LLSLGRILKFSEVHRTHCWAFLQKEKKVVCSNFDKNGLGYILGDFLQTHLVTLLSKEAMGAGGQPLPKLQAL
jgi:hypothetical protein